MNIQEIMDVVQKEGFRTIWHKFKHEFENDVEVDGTYLPDEEAVLLTFSIYGYHWHGEGERPENLPKTRQGFSLKFPLKFTWFLGDNSEIPVLSSIPESNWWNFLDDYMKDK